MNDHTESQAEDNLLVLERIFKATPEQVFDAFASAEAMKQWFGPEGCQVLEANLDFRVGGQYHLQITTETGPIDLVGIYQTIERPNHLAFSWRWENNDAFQPCDSYVEIIFRRDPRGTFMRLVQTGIDHEQDRNNHVLGWNSTLDKLEQFFPPIQK